MLSRNGGRIAYAMTQIGDRTAVEFVKSDGAAYVELRSALVGLLFRYDPIQISYGTNCEEYAPEAENIVARLGLCYSAEDVCVVVFEELVRSFGTEAVGAIKEYERVAVEVWELWQGFAMRR